LLYVNLPAQNVVVAPRILKNMCTIDIIIIIINK